SYAAGHATPTAGQILVTTWDGSLTYASGEAPDGTNGDRLVASYLVDRARCVQVTLTGDTTREAYIVPDGNLLAQLVAASSTLVDAAAGARAGTRPRTGVSA